MAFAAPLEVAGGAAASEGAAATRAASARSAATKVGATGVTVPTKTAAARADELVKSGTGRGRARRALADEYGATGGQADDLLDAAGTRNPPAPTPDEPAPPAGPAPRSSSNGVQVPRAVSRAAASSGGLILGGLTYVLALVYLRGGSAGLKTWLRAKFLNKTGASTPKADHSSTATTPGVGNAGSGFTLITGGGAGGAGAGVAGSSSPTTKASGGGW